MKQRTKATMGKSGSVVVQSKASSPRRILVVNGDSDLLQLSTEVLIRQGYQADAAADGAVAWKALTKHRYDLLITDYQIPKLSGVRLLQKLRSASLAVPVIMATTTFPRIEATLLPWVQPTVTLLMPYTVSEFLETVEGVLRAKVKGRLETSPSPKSPADRRPRA